MSDMWTDPALCDAEEGHAVQEVTAFDARLREAIWEEAKSRLGLGSHPHSPNAFNPNSSAARRLHLMHLEVASQAGEAMRQLSNEIAARAARAGATYPELGDAAGGLSRQAARKRWPDAVGTQWTLYTMTGASHPRGMTVSAYRSREKAISIGQYEVRQGQSTIGGVLATVVTNSERTVVWACHFDDGVFDAVDTRLPDDLTSVPAPDSPDRADWVHRWEQHVDSIT